MTTIKTLDSEFKLNELDQFIHKHLENGIDFIELAMNSHTLAFNKVIEESDIENCDSNYFMTQMIILGNKFKGEFADKCEEECDSEGFNLAEYFVLNVVGLYQNRIYESGNFDDSFDIDEVNPAKHGINNIDDLENSILELITEHSIDLGVEKGVFSISEDGSINLTPKFIPSDNDKEGFPFVKFNEDDLDDYEPPNYPNIDNSDCKSTWSCYVDPNLLVKSGYTVIFPYIWSHTDNGLTPSKDISILLDNDCILTDALYLIEEASLKYVKEHGADNIRHYFIEDVIINDDKKTIEFVLGT